METESVMDNLSMKGTMKQVADLMALSARTAPKGAGKDFINIKVVQGEDLSRLAEAMVTYGGDTGRKNFDRDGKNILNSDALLLIALNNPQPVGLNCGACGHDSCTDLREREGREFAGPVCAWRLADFGIALGSAVKTASILNADNRIMYRVGVVARKIGLIEGQIAAAIPLSGSGKNIYFDR